jgi:transcriptional regulator with XRE-family HTH domain
MTLLPTTQPEIGEFLRVLREHAGLNQAQLAVKAGIAKETICRIEVGRQKPSRRLLDRWLAQCGCAVWIGPAASREGLA